MLALELGKNGDVDVVTVHDPVQEAAFIAGDYAVEAQNFSTERVTWAYNYFIIVGPEADPAGISGGDLTPEEAFQKIQIEGEADPETVKFVSRGDNSGTHGKEKAIWKSAGYNYTADIEGTGAAAGWYIEAGTGMGATLVMADEHDGLHPDRQGNLPCLPRRLGFGTLVGDRGYSAQCLCG